MYYPDDSTLVFRFNIKECIQEIISALENSDRISFDEMGAITYYAKKRQVTFCSGKRESSYHFKSYKSFLGFKYGYRNYTLSSGNPYLGYSDWEYLGKTMNLVNYRFGIN